MKFSDILPVLQEGTGRRARRAAWQGFREDWRGCWVEIVRAPPLPDGREIMPQLVVGYPDGTLRPFAGANWDLLSDDWEIVEP